MTTASPAQQRRLLEVQRLDTRMTQIRHRQVTSEDEKRVAALEARLAGLRDRLVAARVTLDDAEREATKAESDVEQVVQRRRREQERLESGSLPPKQLTALQGDIAHLDRRAGELESTQLEAMERQDATAAAHQAVRDELDAVDAELVEARRTAAESGAALEEELAAVRAERGAATQDIPGELLSLYDKVRERSGVGAAALVGRRCEGCRIDLTEGDLGVIRGAADDAVVRCEECGRILVRTEQSAV